MDILVSKHVRAASHGGIHSFTDNPKPEWLRVPDAVRLFGLSRSRLYELITAGAIKSTSLKKPGAVRGIRLVSFDSLAAYIEQAASGEGTAR